MKTDTEIQVDGWAREEAARDLFWQRIRAAIEEGRAELLRHPDSPSGQWSMSITDDIGTWSVDFIGTEYRKAFAIKAGVH